MKNIHTLIPDIYELTGRKDWFNADLARYLSDDLSVRLQEHFSGEQKAGLRLSQMGSRCPCALWYSVHHPDLAEALPPWAKIKYAYGHILEGLVIALAKAAGHEVLGEQGHVTVDGISGHRDCVIDGCVLDVKSASSYSFKKFKDKSIGQDDPFGYLEQLDGYVVGSLEDDIVRVKDRGYLLAIDKTLGHMCLYEHAIRPDHIKARIKNSKAIIELPKPPACSCGTRAQGKSGNVELDMRASYSPYKYCCFPYLRTFIYADGPVYLTKVIRKPDVTEVDKNGKVVYN